MAEPITAQNPCEHDWQYNKPAHATVSVRICATCHTIDGEDLMRTLDEYAQEYAKLFQPKPVTLTYGWSDGSTCSVVDRSGGIPDPARERALLRALLMHALRQLDEHDHPLHMVSMPGPPDLP